MTAVVDTLKQAKLCGISDVSKCVRSKTDSKNTKPNRAKPNTGTEESACAELCKGSKLPRCKRSSTSIGKLKYAKLRGGNGLSRWRGSRASTGRLK